jgi:Cu+-exporting ATPase
VEILKSEKGNKEWEHVGKTVIDIKIDKKLVGQIGMSDIIKDGVSKTIDDFKDQEIQVIMMTGDKMKSANFVAKQAKLNNVMSDMTPERKANEIKYMREMMGRNIVMVGDGINDAPALVQADVGIAMSNGSDIAIESAQITILKGDIGKVYKSWKLSKSTLKTIKEPSSILLCIFVSKIMLEFFVKFFEVSSVFSIVSAVTEVLISVSSNWFIVIFLFLFNMI